MSAAPDAIRADRERFIAFAFCAADAFVETDRDLTVLFAAGSLQPALGRDRDDLRGGALSDLFGAEDAKKLERATAAAIGGKRVADLALSVLLAEGDHRPVTVSAYAPPKLPGRVFLAFRQRRIATAAPAAAGPAPAIASGADAERSLAADIEAAMRKGGPMAMTTIDLGDVGALRERLAPGGWDGLQQTIAASLRQASRTGSAQQYGDNRYSLVHDAGADVDALKREIGDATRAADPNGAGADISTATSAIDAQTAKDEHAMRAFVMAVKTMADDPQADFTADGFAGRLEAQTAKAADDLTKVRHALDTRSWAVAYQPIISLTDREMHHTEALVRLAPSVGMPPFEFIRFLEQTDLVARFDAAMAADVIAAMTAKPLPDALRSVAVNISGRSLETPGFIDNLRAALGEKTGLEGRLLFEITESERIRDLKAANRLIGALRSDGYPVCLDDFGAGESAFEYLRALEIDFVKIDGSYIQYAENDARGRAFLRAMVQLCSSLGVDTIAERVETGEMAGLLTDLGVGYAQGYYFGRPVAL